MKKETRWKLFAGAGLVLLSLALYTTHYLLFHDAHHIMVFGLHELAFIPLEVLVVTLIIDQMLESREKKQRMEKLNMVIGTFFSTTGTPLLALLVRADPCLDTLRQRLVVSDSWSTGDFAEVKAVLGTYDCGVEIERIDLAAARDFLVQNEEFLLRLVENPMVFEHESFTDLIFALSHLTEELKAATAYPASRRRIRDTLPSILSGPIPASSPNGCGTWNTSRSITRTCSTWPCGRTRSMHPRR
jgi:hypothetical protein